MGIDPHKAKVFTRLHSSLMDRQCLTCPLLRTEHLLFEDLTILEFEYPKGEALSKRIEKSGYLSEDVARALCRDIFRSVVALHEISMTFCGILPLGCVLSAYGAHRTALTVIHGNRAKCLA